MKPQHLKIPNSADHSFSVRKDTIPNINNRWHYHTEIELICFHKGTGTQFVGDHIKRFAPGDIVLVGSDLPHYWKYDAICFTDKDQEPAARAAIPEAYSTVIHFFDNFMGERFLVLPEAKPIKNILDKAKRGILIKEQHAEDIALRIEKIFQAEGLHKIIALLECLMAIASLPQIVQLSSIGFKSDFRESENERMNNIYNFALNNFRKKIQLGEIAAVADLVPNSFCRYFKTRTGKTFSQFLTDIRVGYACKLILDNKMDIKQVCFESGFNNFSCFHKSFKTITGKTPKLYQESHRIG
jgi:YesN/AraC family two-component response regulator